MRWCVSMEKLEKGIPERGNNTGLKPPQLFGEAASN